MEDDPLVVRMGTFFVVMGLGAFILFVTSDLVKKPDFDFLFIALLLIGIGWIFRRKKAPPPSAGRFSIFRRMREDAKKQREEKSKPKQEQKK
jgi:flagellar biosynthesis component FlhA